MQKRPIYGTPINPVATAERLRGESFCLSYYYRQKLDVDLFIDLVGDDGWLLLDNGAFTYWTQHDGAEMPLDYIEGFEAWAADIQARCPQAIAVIPDTIAGTVEQNHQLMIESQLDWSRAMPVWHMHEPLDVLREYCEDWSFVAIGSSGKYAKPGTQGWHSRVDEALAVIEDVVAEGLHGRPHIHMMRAQSQHRHHDFHTSDSTNVAVNHGRQRKLWGHTIEQFAERNVAAPIRNSADGAPQPHMDTPATAHAHTQWQRAFYDELAELRFEREVAAYNSEHQAEPTTDELLTIPEFLRRRAA